MRAIMFPLSHLIVLSQPGFVSGQLDSVLDSAPAGAGVSRRLARALSAVAAALA